MLGRARGPEDGLAQRVLGRVPVLQQREQGCDVRALLRRAGVGVCRGRGGGYVCCRGHGCCVAGRASGFLGRVEGLDAVGERAGFDGACEAQVGTQGVGGP